MNDKIQNVESTICDLLPLLRKYRGGQISYQIRKLEEILSIIQSDKSNESKECEIGALLETLYPIRGGLTDFHVWKDDANEKIKINKPISELIDRLWHLLKT